MRALLDINVLLALLDADHVEHPKARTWAGAELEKGWASCAITQNGFVRIISQPRYPGPIRIPQAIDRLAQATQTKYHQFWSSNVSLLDRDCVNPSVMQGSKQVTDIYLLALAVANNGRFVTFDGGVPLAAVPGAKEDHLVTL